MKWTPTIVIVLFCGALYAQFTPPPPAETDSAVMRGANDWQSVSNSAVASYDTIQNYAVDPDTLQSQIDVISGKLDNGITTNLNGFVIEDGLIIGTF